MTTPSIVNASYESFKILRGVPLVNQANPAINNIWFAAIPTAPGGTPVDPNNQIAYGKYQNTVKPAEPLLNLFGPALSTALNVTIDLTNPINSTLVVDSTRIIVQNLVNNNYIDIVQEDAYCTFVSNDSCPLVTDGPGYYTSSSTNPCINPPNPPACQANGVLQFLALISIAPSCTWLGTGLVITISPLNSNMLFANYTYGNWCPFQFSIGNCNTQSACAALLYLTCPNPSGYGYIYSAKYANVRFTLLNKAKCAQGGAKKACYLGVDSLDKTCFLVFFGQQRLIGSAQILLISPIVDLKAIIWQPVFIVTTNTPLTLTC
jgi:hypothetical protein